MENLGEKWQDDTAKRVGIAVAKRRKTLGMTAIQLSEACAEVWTPIHRTTITKIENGKTKLDIRELLVIAYVLRTSPLQLLYGEELADGAIQVVPGAGSTASAALLWFTGMRGNQDEYVDDYVAANEPVNLVYALHSAQESVDFMKRHFTGADDQKLVMSAVQSLRDIRERMRAAGMSLYDERTYETMEGKGVV